MVLNLTGRRGKRDLEDFLLRDATQSAVMPQYGCRLSVRPSVRDVQVP